jgi:asparagine synthase (glutamine-hydrolysing)
MCGIFGLFNISAQSPAPNLVRVKKALDIIEHRGPDAVGFASPSEGVVLGHRRLAILDLSPENDQPFFVGSNLSMVYNGEIYNYVELREELKDLGYAFRTKGDTEVILHAYSAWGFDCVKRFNGMWSLAIYDKDKDLLFCSRDRFGVKPFNYTLFNNQFLFASEIKSILTYYPELRQPNYNVIANYCRNGLGAQIEQTWFENILRLQPAHNLIVQKGKISLHPYWQYPTKTNHDISFEDAKKQYIDLFTDAVKLRMRSDVPVGTTLSSGLDSSSIVSALRIFFSGEHQTYTACFNNNEFLSSEKTNYRGSVEINERHIVERLAKKLQLTANFIELKDDNFVRDLHLTIFHLESGHSSPAILPLFKIMERAHQDVKVVLEGQGADELLSGYTVHNFFSFLLEHIKKGKLLSAFREWQLFRKSYSIIGAAKMHFRLLNKKFIQDLFHQWKGISSVFGHKLKAYTLIPEHSKVFVPFDNTFNRSLYYQHAGGLVNLLHYGDAISMAHSIESRLPFMDYRLVEFAFSLPYSFKMKDGFGKYIHRKSAELFVPEFILNNPLKFGFSTPLSKHFLKEQNHEILAILLSEKCLSRGIFNENGLKNIIDKHQSGRADHGRFLFRLLSAEIWFRIFIDDSVSLEAFNTYQVAKEN